MMRRDLLKAVALAAGSPAPSSEAARAATIASADVRRIAGMLHGLDVSADDAQTIAAAASEALANLKYLDLLKPDEASTPFGYLALIDEAMRAP